MKKLMTTVVPSILVVFFSVTCCSIVMAKSTEVPPVKRVAAIPFIVKFKDPAIHKSLLSVPETTKALKKMQVRGKNHTDYKKTLNVHSTVAKDVGVKKIALLSEKTGFTVSHVRSMAMGVDLLHVKANESLSSMQIIQTLMATNEFKHVTEDVKMSAKSFNDPKFDDQTYLLPNSSANLYGQNFLSMREQVVNNLGRKVRIGIVDSGSAPHEDINDRADGYDFLVTYDDDRLLADEERDDNPDDVSTLADGNVCHNGHGLSVASLIAAKSDNGLGITGAMDSEQVDLIYARVLDCFGDGSNSDILDAVAWLIGESVPGIPDISEPVDIINLSLGRLTDIGCTSVHQDIYDKARANGVVVFVAAGNENANASKVIPASCGHTIVVGATTDNGEKASFSNFGDNIDIMSAGDGLWMLSSNEFVSQPLYFIGSGTSMATPIAASGAGNLLLKYPDLTPEHIETMMKSNGIEYSGVSVCGQLGCGNGMVDMGQLMSALDNITTSNKYSKEHRYEGYNSETQTTWLKEMDSYTDTCSLVKYTWGQLGHAREGISYKLFSVAQGKEAVEIETIKLPQKIMSKLTGADLAVQSCEKDICGEMLLMSEGELVQPQYCSS